MTIAATTSTDLRRWAALAAKPARKSFSERAEMAAHFVRPGDRVLDLGAGAQPLRELLPPCCTYQAVDCVGTRPGTHVADFNDRNFTLPGGEYTIITALGLLNYLEDMSFFLDRLAEEYEGTPFLFTYDFWSARGHCAKHGVRNGITNFEAGARLFSNWVRNLSCIAVMRRRAMFMGTLGHNDPEPLRCHSITQLAAKHGTPLESLILKITGWPMLPRWLA